MTQHFLRRGATLALAALFLAAAHAAAARVAVHTVKADLRPLIRAAADSPVQFAVAVAHAAATSDSGSWSVSHGQATWEYAVRVPTAVSLSFHAIRSQLPPSATLLVQGARSRSSYRASDLHRGELWSRIYPGEALQLTLSVAAAERNQVALQIVSLQAGYRSLGDGVADHPYFRQLKAQAQAAAGNAACVTNYACAVTAANAPAASATVALVVGNINQCTGVLINDVPQDNTPYLLTARHCQSGTLGGGDPGAAANVMIYWDAISPCGVLGSLYDAVGLPTQFGAQTVVEQQDAWLIKLDQSPVATDAQFAGFDVSGGAVVGGYTVQHAEGDDKQLTTWFGQAAALQQGGVLGVTYLSNFLETVNATGNIGPGASGSGLFDQNNHLVGLLSLGRTTTDPSGYGACPIANPPQPNGSNGAADFTSLAAVWNSTADGTSSTGHLTLKSVLDPGSTGTLTVASEPAAVVTFNASNDSVTFGVPVTLSWSAPNATACTASGGAAGDGWAGALGSAGSQQVTESVSATLTYALACSYSGARTARASVAITWVGPTPQVQLTPPSVVTWAGAPLTFTWISNVAPCSLNGGNVALRNLPGSGSASVTQPTATDIFYTLTCGPADDSGQATAFVSWLTPSLLLTANGTDRLLGSLFELNWVGAYDTPCVPSGGAPGDGWASTSFALSPSVDFYPQVSTPGTYTYTLTCASGPLSLSSSVTVTFENGAPYVSTTLNNPTVTFADSPADYVTFKYDSNLSQCNLISNPTIAQTSNPDGLWQSVPLPQGEVTLAPPQPGTYQLSLNCLALINGVTATASVASTLTVLPPPPPSASITFSPTSVVQGQPFTVAWSSSNASACTESGGISGGPWGQSAGIPEPSGSVVESGQPGTYTFTVSCPSIDLSQGSAIAQATYTVLELGAKLSASPTTVVQGGTFTLTWASTNAVNCIAGGGGADGAPWQGSLSASGSTSQSASAAGTFTYQVSCLAADKLTVMQNVTVTMMPASSGGSSGAAAGGGGGGSTGLLDLALLGALWMLRRRSARLGQQERAPREL